MAEPVDVANIPYAVWPDNAPHESETLIVTVVACESQFRWAVHEGVNEDFFPIVFWRTSAISEAEIEESESSTALLDRYFPDQAKEIVYGSTEKVHSKSTATAYRAAQRIPAVSIYCILPAASRRRDPNEPSAAEISEKGLVYMLKGSFPCNLYKLQASDLWATEGIWSTEQLATVAAVDFLYPGRHCLLIDGGTTLNLTAVAAGSDGSKAVNGSSSTQDIANAAASSNIAVSNLVTQEGATPDDCAANGASGRMQSVSTSNRIVGDIRTTSISGKLRAMHEQTGALPEITSKQVYDTLLDLDEKSTRLAMFAANTFDAMLGTILRETMLFVRSAIKTWALSNMIQPEARSNGSENSYPLVCITGVESDILSKLLTSSGFALEGDPDLIWLPSRTDTPEDSKLLLVLRPPGDAGEEVMVEVKTHRHLAFNGIRRILTKYCKVRKDNMTESEKLRQEILGCRVAKDFGEKVGGVFFGQVMSIDRINQASIDEDLFMVRFDDGDSEEFTVTELHEHLVFYCEKANQNQAEKDKIEIKRADSNHVARVLALTSVAVQQELERKNKNSRSSRAVASRNKGSPAYVEIGSSDEDVAVVVNGVRSATKKRKVSQTSNDGVDPKSFLNRRIAKYFGNALYFGTIVRYEEPTEPDELPMWYALYDDDDEESYEEYEVEQLIALYARPRIHREDKNPNGLAR